MCTRDLRTAPVHRTAPIAPVAPIAPIAPALRILLGVMSIHTASSVPFVTGPIVWLASAVVLAVAIVLHGAMPRYELARVGASGDSVIVFDKWTGQFQRVDYQPNGDPRATPVVNPF